MAAPFLVVYNPVSGHNAGKQFTEEHILPTLESAGRKPDATMATERPGHAGELVLDFLRAREQTKATVLIASGDGTVHEVVNALHETSDGKGISISVILVPVGTANALYASLFPPAAGQDTTTSEYRLQSLHAFLASPSSAKPLTIATTTVSHTSGTGSARVTVRSAVVTSTALHASILHDSEALRAEMPGVERFKVAAQQNITRWYQASVKLLPFHTDPVLRYDPSSKEFKSVKDAALSGPFAYFLATTTVDRLEPTFEVAPLAKRLPPSGPTLDLLILRPTRDPSYKSDTPEARAAFSEKTIKVLMGAYDHGAHVDLVFGPDGAIVPAASAVDAPPVAEVFRCGGWEWTPVSTLFCYATRALIAPAGWGRE